MATSMTYDSLVQDIQTYAERSDTPFVTQIPQFIMLAENRIASEARGLGFLRVVTTTLNSNQLAKPARWRETKSFSITSGGSVIYLQSRGYQYCGRSTPPGLLKFRVTTRTRTTSTGSSHPPPARRYRRKYNTTSARNR